MIIVDIIRVNSIPFAFLGRWRAILDGEPRCAVGRSASQPLSGTRE
jgi:hypothetical protein